MRTPPTSPRVRPSIKPAILPMASPRTLVSFLNPPMSLLLELPAPPTDLTLLTFLNFLRSGSLLSRITAKTQPLTKSLLRFTALMDILCILVLSSRLLHLRLRLRLVTRPTRLLLLSTRAPSRLRLHLPCCQLKSPQRRWEWRFNGLVGC
jgi:hypothetical protein